MKRLFIIFSAAMASFVMGCDNDSTVNPQPTGIAKITGMVYADFNLANNSPSQTWDVVANRKLIIEIYDDYSETSKYMESTTDGTGAYSLEIPVGNRPLEVRIESVDFKMGVTEADNTTVTQTVFYGNLLDANATVVMGGEYIRDIYYNQ